ncbi:MAG: hypothetical protein ABIQ44_15140 [Chloroflexia bacterium]
MSNPSANAKELKRSLSHVRWLGGSTCSGKSSIAYMLTQAYNLQVYQYDKQEVDHIARSTDTERFPEINKFMSMTMDERWVLRSPMEMADNAIKSWAQRFPHVIDDLLAMPTDRTIIAEGPGLFPQLVKPYLSNPFHATWLIASNKVIRDVRSQRPTGIRTETSDPDRAIDNLVERDYIIARYSKDEAFDASLRTMEITFAEPIMTTVQHIAGLFGLSSETGRFTYAG